MPRARMGTYVLITAITCAKLRQRIVWLMRCLWRGGNYCGMARPALERAHPSGAVAGTFRPVDHAVVSVVMDDGAWGHAEAIGWAEDISGRWRIQLLYYDAGSQQEDWWMYDPDRVRLAEDADPPAG